MPSFSYRHVSILYLIIVIPISSCLFTESNPLSDDEISNINSLFAQAEQQIRDEKYDSARLLLNSPEISSQVDLISGDSMNVRWLYLIGMSYLQEGNYENAIGSFERARAQISTIDNELKHDLFRLSESIYSIQGDESNQLGTLLSYLSKVDTNRAPHSNIAFIYLRLARHYGASDHDYIKVVHYVNEAKERLSEKDTTLWFICELYPTLFDWQKSTKERIQFLESLMPLPDGIDVFTQAQFYNALGNLYWEVDDYQNTLLTSKEYLRVARQAKTPRLRKFLTANAWVNLGDAYMNLGKYDIALSYLDSANTYKQHLSTGFRQALYWNRAEIYHRLGYSVDSLQQVFYAMGDDIVDLLMDKSRTDMFALSEREKENALLLQEKTSLLRNNLILQRNVIILIVSFACIVGFFYMRLQKKRLSLLNLQNRVISGQLNPHFISNAIYASMLMVEYEVPRAYNYLSKLHHFIRHLFETYQRDFVTLSNELKMLTNYIEIEKTKLDEGQISFNCVLPDELNADQILITPMLIQPIIENAIKYSQPSRINKITMNFEIINSQILKCVVTDTGKGVSESISVFPEGHSLYHIKAYNDLVTKNESLLLRPNQSSSGTVAELLIRYRTT